MAGGEKGHAGEMAGKAGDFLKKAWGAIEHGQYVERPVELALCKLLGLGPKEGILGWLFAKGALGGLLLALGTTFAREFIAGGGGH